MKPSRAVRALTHTVSQLSHALNLLDHVVSQQSQAVNSIGVRKASEQSLVLEANAKQPSTKEPQASAARTLCLAQARSTEPPEGQALAPALEARLKRVCMSMIDAKKSPSKGTKKSKVAPD